MSAGVGQVTVAIYSGDNEQIFLGMTQLYNCNCTDVIKPWSSRYHTEAVSQRVSINGLIDARLQLFAHGFVIEGR